MKKMKTKNKTIAVLEIAIVLCSVLLVAIPAIAAEQNQEMQKASTNEVTTASEDDYALDIYGNANEDDTIDMGDVVYTKLAIFGKKPKTELCDAKYDGRINVLDVIQTKLIILGKEKELTIVDVVGEAKTIRKPVERIVALKYPEVLRAINAGDKIVGISTTILDTSVLSPELSKLPSVGRLGSLDYEAILNLNPDLVLTFSSWGTKKMEKLPGVTVIGLSLRYPVGFTEGVRQLGYILDKKEEVEEYINWHEGWTNKIKARTEGLSEDEKPKVFYWISYLPGEGHRTCTDRSRIHVMCDPAGGINVAADLKGLYPVVDSEWMMEQNPDIIVTPLYYTVIRLGYGTDDPSEMVAAREDILNRPELAHVTAVKNERVYMMSNEHLAAGGSGCLIGTAYMAKWFHPTLFEDMDPKAIHQEYLRRLQLDYDLDKHGVFVYPEEPV